MLFSINIKEGKKSMILTDVKENRLPIPTIIDNPGRETIQLTL
jgi:hypothetical protein